MIAFKSLATAVAALALVGVAVAAPSQDENANRNVRTGDPQVDRAALWRTTNVGECAAIQQRQVSTNPKHENGSKRAKPARRQTLAYASCSVVWTE